MDNKLKLLEERYRLRSDVVTLWPRTVLNSETIQKNLSKWHGYTDYGFDLSNPESRIYQTLSHLKIVPDPFTVMDIACGDGKILFEVGHRYDCSVYGVDINYKSFAPEYEVHQRYVKFYAADMMDIFESDLRPDVVIMFNTYSAWDRSTDGVVPFGENAGKCEKWIFEHAKYLIADLKPHQLEAYKSGRFLYAKGLDKKFNVYEGTAASMIEIL